MTPIAYLILAHQEPSQCQRLIEALRSSSTRVFVHVDAKVDSRAFAVNRPNVVFVRDRIAVNRGGWSLTRAMVRTLRAAFIQSDCRYFIFLAGTDYPIKPQGYIASFLDDRYPMNFINYYPLLNGASGLWNFDRYHFVDQSCWVARMLKFKTQGFEDRDVKFCRLVDRLNRALPRRVFPKASLPFRGSDRWCLNRDTVRYVLECWRSRLGRRYRRYFRYTWGSDEMLFQTMIFNSRLAEQCHLYDAEAVRAMAEGSQEPWTDEVKANVHYVDWNEEREDPAILDERDYARLEGTEALFASKFYTHRSAGLLALVDARLRREVPET